MAIDELQIVESLARDLDGLWLGGEKRRVAEAKFSMQTFVGDGQHRAGFFAAHLGNGEKRRGDHVDAGNVLLVELLNQRRGFLKQRIGGEVPAQMVAYAESLGGPLQGVDNLNVEIG